ncbi:hypothetical protein TNCV_842201 [Trichonephila clavipes]|nr:hypothetical protein TNCV_842201 [Trichonephila clavipes]
MGRDSSPQKDSQRVFLCEFYVEEEVKIIFDRVINDRKERERSNKKKKKGKKEVNKKKGKKEKEKSEWLERPDNTN